MVTKEYESIDSLLENLTYIFNKIYERAVDNESFNYELVCGELTSIETLLDDLEFYATSSDIDFLDTFSIFFEKDVEHPNADDETYIRKAVIELDPIYWDDAPVIQAINVTITYNLVYLSLSITLSNEYN